eukprot:11356-Eustigmatos_ZCMA.PRE.1
MSTFNAICFRDAARGVGTVIQATVALTDSPNTNNRPARIGITASQLGHTYSDDAGTHKGGLLLMTPFVTL